MSALNQGAWIKCPDAKRLWVQVLSATFVGTYLATWLQQVSFKLSLVGIAQTLSTTSPLFAIPIGALMGEKTKPAFFYGGAAGNWRDLAFVPLKDQYPSKISTFPGNIFSSGSRIEQGRQMFHPQFFHVI